MNALLPVSEGTYRATLAVVDLDAISHNLSTLRSLLPPSVAICAVVKADAYGHGAVPVSKELEAQKVDAFGVATIEEGLELRRAGIQRPIMVLGYGFSGIEAAQEHGLAPVIYSPGTARRISEAVRQMKKPLSVHLKLDTGMGRLGLLEDQWAFALEELLGNPWIRLEGIATHLSSAESDPDFTRAQLHRFEEALEKVRRVCGVGQQRIHVANSAGSLNHPESLYDMVRLGLLLYGAYPEPGLKDKVLVRPAMTFKTQVLYVKSLPAGSPVSYGQTYHTKRASRIATVAAGYADGYRRDLSNRGWVLIRGCRAPVVGNVTMDLTMVDVTDVPGVSEGDEVTLFGPAGGSCLPVEELAEEIGTISYELLCAVSRRVPRVYAKGGKVVDVP